MNCRDYVFKLSSGQLQDAGWLERLQAGQHRLICRHCRAFTRNDERLSELLVRYREGLEEREEGREGPG